jgi:hypothetical protein
MTSMLATDGKTANDDPLADERTIPALTEAATKGDADAQFVLAKKMLSAVKDPKEDPKAEEWLRKAVAQNHVKAMVELAENYSKFGMLPRSRKEAFAEIDALLSKTPELLCAKDATMFDKVEFFRHLVTARQLDAPDRKPAYEHVRAVVAKEAPDSSLLATVEGDFLVKYAWDARSRKFANQVTEEQFKVFGERLQAAEKAFVKAWELDNTNARAAVGMITVSMGRGDPRPDMEKWFQRAIKAAPKDIRPYWAKQLYLEPKWMGDPEGKDLIAFGRECVKNADWNTRIPIILIDIHQAISRYPTAERPTLLKRTDPKYFEDPAIWADVQSVFEPYLRRHPNSHKDRTSYAKFACYAGQWKKARELFQELGDRAVVRVFHEPEELKQLQKSAEEKGRD